MGFQISPGINVSEIDLTTIIPAVGTTVGAIAGPFRWGPANKPMLIDNELTLVNTFGKPDNSTANTWFTAANFLAYANALQTVRVVREDSVGHKNATADGSGVLIANEDVYSNNYANGQGNVGMFAAKYPGDLGNSLAVSIADADSFNSWPYKTSFTGAPGTSTLVANGGGSNDEMHIVVIDTKGWWTGTAGSVLEPFAFVSKCAAAKYEDGSTIYYPEVINRKSKFVWWMDHPTEDDLGTVTDPNWGASAFTTNFDTTSVKVIVTTPVGTFTPGEVVADAAGASVSAGSGAVLGTPVRGTGGIILPGLGVGIPVTAPGTGYTAAPDVVIYGGGGVGATATATVNAGGVTGVTVTGAGSGFTSPPSVAFETGVGGTCSPTKNVSGFITSGTAVQWNWTNVAGPNDANMHYVIAPSVVITDSTGTGAGATAHAVVAGGVVTNFVVDNPGSSAYTTPVATLTPVGSGATAGTVVLDTNKVISIGVTTGGTGYVGSPTVSITGGGGTSATATCTVSSGVIQSVTVTNGGSGYTTAPSAAIVPVGSGASAVVTVNGVGRVVALTPTAVGSGYSNNPLYAPKVVISGPGVGAQVTANVVGGQVTSYTVTSGGSGYQTISATVKSYAAPTLTVSPISGTFTVDMNLQGVTSGATATVVALGGGVISKTLSGGVDANDILLDGNYQITETGSPAGYAMFHSGEDIDVSLVLGADADQETALYLINDIAEYRKDCVVFLSPPKSAVLDNSGNEAADIIAFRNLLPSTSYAVMDSGWKYQYDKYNDIYRWVPLNGDVAGLCVRTDNLRDPWWSPAGYNRGFIQNVVRLAWNPRKAYRDVMYQSGINAVISEAGQGTLLYGDKTMLSKPSAFDRINVRRLFIVLEKAISTAAKYTLFEFNDQFTRAQFVNMVEPYLRDVMGRRGIYDFRVVCDATNNTPEVIDGNRFVGDIYIKPARSINFIQLNFIAVRTGVDFTEIVGKF